MSFIVSLYLGVKIVFLSLARASPLTETKLSSSKYWCQTDNLNVSSYLRDAKAIIEPRHRLEKIIIFVRFGLSSEIYIVYTVQCDDAKY